MRRVLPWSALTLAFFYCAQATRAQTPDFVRENSSAQFQSAVGEARPLALLPPRIQAADGKVTLWADYQNTSTDAVPLYLVNRSGEDLVLDSQDNDLYIKLETTKEDGTWTRAQGALFSWCGNSYFPVALPAGHYFEFRGYRSPNGTKRPVRYACYGRRNIISNTGEGLISPDDLRAAREDSMAERTWAVPNSVFFPIYKPVWTYAPHAPPEVRTNYSLFLDTLHLLPLMARDERLLAVVARARETLAAVPATPDTQAVLQEIDKVQAHQWPSGSPASPPLAQLCFQRLYDPANTTGGSNTISEYAAWRVLSIEARALPSPHAGLEQSDLSQWRPLLAQAQRALEDASTPKPIAHAASLILGSPGVVDPLVGDATVIAWLQSPHQELQKLGVQALARREQHALLLYIARGLSPQAQLDVLRVLGATGTIRAIGHKGTETVPISEAERQFWAHCFETQPWDFLLQASYNDRVFLMGDAVRLPLKELLVQEAKTGASAPKDFHLDKKRAQTLRRALQVLDEFQQVEDNALFQKLTKHRGLVSERVNLMTGGGFDQDVSIVAQTATHILKRRTEVTQQAGR
ncbi:hypothetical protein [Roseimicrobium sp. ORNL1]|uniref:hypothetical protein n=1 Tax=Roseimicrobium sp. ORNL1 TaxID=2711231 RepID=UPI0013E1D83A|nr:hypothetical protein [Roseimicrobium sp. ORNL1]QIF00369.1 hypothetical protein G5S37_02120 [Roseimicrobium sp. ORNL1]